MAVIKLAEDYAVSQLRKDVRDSLSMAGERAILLKLYHASDPDAVPCEICGDDTYKSPELDCGDCYGTLFQGGVKVAMMVWSLFTDKQSQEQLGPRGIYEPDMRSVQFEAFPKVIEHDVLVRISEWGSDHTPAKIKGFYMLTAVTQRSLRTGNRAGQYNWDIVGQKAQLSELSENMKAITRYPIIGQQFFESVELTPASPTTPAHAVVEPDVKTIYFPFEPGPGGVTTGGAGGPGTASNAYVHHQNIAASIWTIDHPLGYEPGVCIIVDNEEVEADVDYPNNSVVVITFNTPQRGMARLT